MTILEVYPAANGGPPIQRVATAPRDLASSLLLLLYCALSTAAVCVAFAAVLVSGLHYKQYSKCLLSYMPNGEHLCSFTYMAAGLTAPLAAGVMVTELLPDSRVSPSVRNLVPLALETIGIALWGVAAGAIHERYAEGSSEGWWRRTLEQLAWCNMSLFLICCCIKLLSPVLEPCIDSSSICLGRLCPEGCMPACDACCCLNVNSAKVPREVFRHGQVVQRFMTWNQELVTTTALPEVLEPMSW